MGEIKSTLDIALERIKKIEITEKEREEIKHKEISQKALSLANRYIEDALSLHEIQKEIEKIDDHTRKILKEIILSRWIEGLSLQSNDEKLITGIELLKERQLNEIKDEFQMTVKQFEKEKEKIREKLKTKLIDSLRKEGFEGSAILVDVDSSDLWKEENVKLNQSYEKKLKMIKEKLKSLTS